MTYGIQYELQVNSYYDKFDSTIKCVQGHQLEKYD
jgi:hypothetical protein